MTQKGEPDVTVLALHDNEDGNLIGELRWSAAPGAVFTLELTPDGRLIEWRARADSGQTLSARRLRAAPIGGMERALRRHVSRHVETLHERLSATYSIGKLVGGKIVVRPATSAERAEKQKRLQEAVDRLADFVERPRTGPVGRSDRSYAAVAALYVEAVAQGSSRPVHVVADRMQLAEKTIQNYLFKARERGLLTSLGRGKAGGQLTDKAKEMLNGNDQAP